jgi:hypothetical protein
MIVAKYIGNGLVTGFVLLLSLACGSGSKDQENTEATATINLEQARDAIIALLQRDARTTNFKDHVEELKNLPIEHVEASHYRIGNWDVDQERLDFAAVFQNAHMILEYSGKFEKDKNGKWKAIITGESRGKIH